MISLIKKRFAWYVKKIFLLPLKIGRGFINFQMIYEALHKIALDGMNYGVGDFHESGEIYVMKYIKDEYAKNKASIIVFDVGANVGNYSQEILKQFSSCDLNLFCFEPSSRMFKTLSTNVANEKAKLYNFGFGSDNATKNLFSAEIDSGLGSIYQRRLDHLGVKMKKTEDIAIKVLDEFCAENLINRVHFLKIDVEGNELEVLKGAAKMINENCIDFIQFEFGGCNIDSRTYFQDFYYFLKDKYNIYRIVKNGLYPIEKYKEEHEVFLTINYLCESKHRKEKL